MSDRAIQEAVQVLSGTRQQDKVYTIDAVVKSVNKAKRTCIVQAISGRANNTFTARLMASVDDGILMLPTVGSTVVITRSDYSRAYVSQYSEIDQIIMRGGDLGGQVIVGKLVDRLNRVEQALRDLIQKYNTHVHPGVTTGPGSSGPTVNQESGLVTDTTIDEIENKNVTHG